MMELNGKYVFCYETPDKTKHIREFDTTRYGITSATQIEYQVMASHFTKTNFEWTRLQEIKEVLDKNLFRSALILALTIPDICSRIEYSNQTDTPQKRYAKWFDDNISKYNVGEIGPDKNFDCFNGYMCYLLRCRMIHGESKDIRDVPNRDESSLKKAEYDIIDFIFTNNTYSEFFKFEGKKKAALFCKSIPQLVMQIISCADGFYHNTKDKRKFTDACNIQIPLPMVEFTI